MKRKNLWFIIGSAILGALFYLIFQDSIYCGFLIEVKYILEAFRSKGSSVSFPKGWNDLIKGANYELDSTIFLLFLMYIFIFLEAWAIIKRRNFFLATFVTLPFIIAPILVPLTPSYFAIALLFAFYGMSMFLSPTIGGNKVFKKRSKRLSHLITFRRTTHCICSTTDIIINNACYIINFPSISISPLRISRFCQIKPCKRL